MNVFSCTRWITHHRNRLNLKEIGFVVKMEQQIDANFQFAELKCAAALQNPSKNAQLVVLSFNRQHSLGLPSEYELIRVPKVIALNSRYGSYKTFKKKYNIEFVSANPTGPLHVGHCRGAVLGDSLSNLLIFNGNKVTKEYYVNDYGEQIKSFVSSVYYRILEITENKTFPNDKNLYPGDYIINIAKKIIK
mgnify:CR=1 FL=1